MFSELVQLSFDKIMQTRSYTVIVLLGQNKKFAIYTEPHIGKFLQSFLTEVPSIRPLSHELMDKIFEGLDIRVKQVIINDVQDTIYFARLFLEQDILNPEDNQLIRHILEVDGRPSDFLTLALLNGAPIYCTKEVLDKTIPVEE
jgi:uncharacterized protein